MQSHCTSMRVARGKIALNLWVAVVVQEGEAVTMAKGHKPTQKRDVLRSTARASFLF